jgi:hypothetical protein
MHWVEDSVGYEGKKKNAIPDGTGIQLSGL